MEMGKCFYSLIKYNWLFSSWWTTYHSGSLILCYINTKRSYYFCLDRYVGYFVEAKNLEKITIPESHLRLLLFLQLVRNLVCFFNLSEATLNFNLRGQFTPAHICQWKRSINDHIIIVHTTTARVRTVVLHSQSSRDVKKIKTWMFWWVEKILMPIISVFTNKY